MSETHCVRGILIIVLSCFFKMSAQSQNEFPQNYFQNPMDFPMTLAGNFGELRANHFHSGIDLKTNGEEGKIIRASADGWISRVKLNYWGYGKVVYIDHPNGFTTVYAHLKSFNDEINERVVEEQIKKENVEVELFFEENELPVSVAELIGLSGNTGGSVAPHLHFEIRETSSENPVNPLLFNFKIRDTKKPILRSVKLYGLTSKNAEPIAVSEHKLKFSEGKYECKDTLKSSYPFNGIAVNTVDQLNDAPNSCGIYRLVAHLDGEKTYSHELNRVDFETTRFINAHMDFRAFRRRSQSLHKTFIAPNNALEIYETNSLKGILESKGQEVHQLKWEVWDAHENKSVGTCPLLVNPKTILLNPKERFLHHNMDEMVEIGAYQFLFPRGTFYYNTALKVTELSKRSTYFTNKAVQLFDDWQPVQKKFGVNVSIELTKNSEQYFISTIDRKGRIRFNRSFYHEGILSAKVKRCGKFVVVRDSIQPSIKVVKNYNNKSWSSFGEIAFEISDDLSGIQKVDAWMNEQWVPIHYEPKRRKVWLIPKDLDGMLSENSFLLKVTDEVGNKVSVTINFTK